MVRTVSLFDPFRDTQPDIRAICMWEIGVWMKRYPGMFLDDAYLKYVGWTLYDKVSKLPVICVYLCLILLFGVMYYDVHSWVLKQQWA